MAPEAPTNLRALPLENPIDQTKPLVRLTWRASTVGVTPTAYKVYVDGVLFETTSLMQSNVTPLNIGQIYTFTVSAIDAAGDSEVATVERIATIAPTEPMNVQVVPDHESLHVSWEPPQRSGGTAISGYRVLPIAGLPGKPAVCESTGPTSCTIANLINGRHYDVTVEAKNGGWPTLRGPESIPAIGIPNAQPSGPRNLRVVSGGSTSVVLSWTTPENIGSNPIVGYTISMFNAEGFLRPEYPQINVGAGVRQYRLLGLTPGLEYSFGVQAFTDKNSGGMTLNALHNPLGLPSAPALVEIAGVGNTTVRLTWEAPDPDGGVAPSDYLVTATPQAPVPAGVLTEETLCPVAATTEAPNFECDGAYLWMHLVNGVTYSFTVTAKNKFGWSPSSTYPAIATPEGTPPPPLITTSLVTSPTSISLSWSPSVTAGGPDVGPVLYTVTFDGSTTRPVPGCLLISVTRCVITNLVFGADYDVTVKAFNTVFGGDDFSSSALTINTNPIQVPIGRMQVARATEVPIPTPIQGATALTKMLTYSDVPRGLNVAPGREYTVKADKGSLMQGLCEKNGVELSGPLTHLLYQVELGETNAVLDPIALEQKVWQYDSASLAHKDWTIIERRAKQCTGRSVSGPSVQYLSNGVTEQSVEGRQGIWIYVKAPAVGVDPDTEDGYYYALVLVGDTIQSVEYDFIDAKGLSQRKKTMVNQVAVDLAGKWLG